MNVVSYGKDIWQAISSTFEGMSITFSHLMRRPMTIQYPDKIPVPIQETLPRRYRGILEVDMDICTRLLGLRKRLPDHLHYDRHRDEQRDQSSVNSLTFDIDVCKCMYCGLCSEACPTGAIRHSQEFEGASYNPAGLVRHFAPQPAKFVQTEKGRRNRSEAGDESRYRHEIS